MIRPQMVFDVCSWNQRRKALKVLFMIVYMLCRPCECLGERHICLYMGLHTGAPGLPKSEQAIHTVKRNLHQMERGKTMHYLWLMVITIHVFAFLDVRSLMP